MKTYSGMKEVKINRKTKEWRQGALQIFQSPLLRHLRAHKLGLHLKQKPTNNNTWASWNCVYENEKSGLKTLTEMWGCGYYLIRKHSPAEGSSCFSIWVIETQNKRYLQLHRLRNGRELYPVATSSPKGGECARHRLIQINEPDMAKFFL
jgi:hypothetical protein